MSRKSVKSHFWRMTYQRGSGIFPEWLGWVLIGLFVLLFFVKN